MKRFRSELEKHLADRKRITGDTKQKLIVLLDNAPVHNIPKLREMSPDIIVLGLPKRTTSLFQEWLSDLIN